MLSFNAVIEVWKRCGTPRWPGVQMDISMAHDRNFTFRMFMSHDRRLLRFFLGASHREKEKAFRKHRRCEWSKKCRQTIRMPKHLFFPKSPQFAVVRQKAMIVNIRQTNRSHWSDLCCRNQNSNPKRSTAAATAPRSNQHNLSIITAIIEKDFLRSLKAQSGNGNSNSSDRQSVGGLRRNYRRAAIA